MTEFDKVVSTSIDNCSCLKAKWSSDGHSSSDLRSLFKQLGMCMVEVGLLVARLCDTSRSHRSICEGSLEQAILESGTAKGRLIHYHSLQEQEALSSLRNNLHKGQEQNKSANGGRKTGTSNLAIDSGVSVSTRWQQWHCDYGIFTILTSPLFLKPTRIIPSEADGIIQQGCCLENELPGSGVGLETNHAPADQISSWDCLSTQPCSSQNAEAKREENSRLPNSPLLSSPHFFSMDSSAQECAPPDEHSSLLVMDRDGRTTSLVVPSDYLIVQVGEAAQLLSVGKLVARAHCVMRPSAAEDVSRETMAVFLQPAWDRRLCLPPGIPSERALEAGGIATHLETHIPLLASRWKEGCTFAEFSKETTRQYYGAGAHQTRR